MGQWTELISMSFFDRRTQLTAAMLFLVCSGVTLIGFSGQDVAEAQDIGCELRIDEAGEGQYNLLFRPSALVALGEFPEWTYVIRSEYSGSDLVASVEAAGGFGIAHFRLGDRPAGLYRAIVASESESCQRDFVHRGASELQLARVKCALVDPSARSDRLSIAGRGTSSDSRHIAAQFWRLPGGAIADGADFIWDLGPGASPTFTFVAVYVDGSSISASCAPGAAAGGTGGGLAIEEPEPAITPTVVVVPAITPTVVVVPAITPTVVAVPAITPTVVAVPAITPTVVAVPAITPTVVAVPAITPTVVVTPAITARPDRDEGVQQQPPDALVRATEALNECRVRAADIANSQLVFQPSLEMVVGRTESVRAVITRDTSAAADTVLPVPSPQAIDVALPCTVELMLSSAPSDFEIQPSDWSDQTVPLADAEVTWVWQVKPRVVGTNLPLTLSVRGWVPLDGGGKQYTLQSSREVVITVDTSTHTGLVSRVWGGLKTVLDEVKEVLVGLAAIGAAAGAIVKFLPACAKRRASKKDRGEVSNSSETSAKLLLPDGTEAPAELKTRRRRLLDWIRSFC